MTVLRHWVFRRTRWSGYQPNAPSTMTEAISWRTIKDVGVGIQRVIESSRYATS